MNQEKERYEQAQDFWTGFFRARGFPEGFLGSRADGESEIEHIQREADWKEEHKCTICGNFFCDGECLEENNEM